MSGGWCAVAMMLAAASEPAGLTKARKAWLALDAPAAAKALDEALATEGNSRAVMLELYELLGVVAASRKQPDAAREAFRRLITLAPQHRLTERSPRIATLFFEAQALVSRDGALSVEARAEPQGTSAVALWVDVRGNTLRLGETVRAHYRADGGTWQVRDGPSPEPLRLSVDCRQLEYWAEVLGAHAAQLQLAGSEAAPLVAQSAAPPDVVSAQPPQPPQPPPARLPRWLGLAVAGLGAGALVAGVGVGVHVSSARAHFIATPAGYTRAEAYELNGRVKAEAVAANVLMVAGAVLAALGIGLWLLDL